MDWIVRRRLRGHRLSGRLEGEPVALCGHLGVLQAQNPMAARWAMGIRMAEMTEEAVAEALDAGRILRTHLLRGTWHLVAANEYLDWMELVAPPGLSRSQRRYGQLGLDGATFVRAEKVICEALEGGNHLTRAALKEALVDGGVDISGQRLPYILQHAELQCLLCSGRREGKHETFALVAERVPQRVASFAREEALVMLVRRYFRSRGPATYKDLQWWSGLPAKELRMAIDALASELEQETVAERTYWFIDEGDESAGGEESGVSESVHLLPAFDEYIVGYTYRDDVLDAKYTKRVNAGGGMIAPCVLHDGVVIGTWRKVVRKREIQVHLDLFAPDKAPPATHLAQSLAGYSAFLGCPVQVVGRE